MRYRDARLLKEGDTVVSKFTGAIYLVQSVEIYGKERPIRINCNYDISFWHTEVE
jgi:hypothetical protein